MRQTRMAGAQQSLVYSTFGGNHHFIVRPPNLLPRAEPDGATDAVHRCTIKTKLPSRNLAGSGTYGKVLP